MSSTINETARLLDKLLARLVKQGGKPLVNRDGKVMIAADGTPFVRGISAAMCDVIRRRARDVALINSRGKK